MINDGSGQEYDSIFGEVKDKVQLLKHAVNQGKGRALKTGFHHILNTYSEKETNHVMDELYQYKILKLVMENN